MGERPLGTNRMVMAVDHEIVRQDAIHPDGYAATRDGIRLCLAAVEDELIEALGAWRDARCKCPVPRCMHPVWGAVATELVQVAAVALRGARAIAEVRVVTPDEEAPAPPAENKVVDLMAALEASVADAKAARKRPRSEIEEAPDA